MANAIYPKWKESLVSAALSGVVKATLIDLADYTYSDTHDFINDIPVAARVATVAISTGKTFTNGLFDAGDVTFPSVTGDQSEALVIWIDTTVEATSRIVAFFDSGVEGLPVTPNGGDINITWNVAGIFQL